MSKGKWRSDPPDEAGFWWMRETRHMCRIVSCVEVSEKGGILWVATSAGWLTLDAFLVGASQNNKTEWCKAEVPE